MGTVFQVVAYLLVKTSDASYESKLHKPVGTAITIIGVIVMPGLGVTRPPATKPNEEKTIKRFVWELLHKNIGKIVLLLAFFNVQGGINLFDSNAQKNDVDLRAVRIAALVVAVFVLAMIVRSLVNNNKAIVKASPVEAEAKEVEL